MNEDLDILGDNEECDEELQGGESSTQKKRNLKVRTYFHEQWKNKYKWLREANNEGKKVMKCIMKHLKKIYHVELELVSLPWNMIQLLFMLVQASIKFHKKNGYVEMRGKKNLLQNT